MGWNDRHCPSTYSPTPSGMRALYEMSRPAPNVPDDEDMLLLIFSDEIEAEHAARKADR